MYGRIVTPPMVPGSDFGVIFMHNEGYSTMCGHGIIAVATVAVTTGMVAAREPETMVRIDTPAGVVTSIVSVENGAIGGVRFRNVPAFVVSLDDTIEVPGLGQVRMILRLVVHFTRTSKTGTRPHLRSPGKRRAR